MIPLSRAQTALLDAIRAWQDEQHAPCPRSVLHVDLVLTAEILDGIVYELVAAGLLASSRHGLEVV